MDPKPDVIRQQIEETRSSLTEKLEALEGEVRGTVENAKESVEETIANVKSSVRETVASVKRTFDVSYQVDRHPWAMVGGSILAGYLVGNYLGRQPRRPQRGPQRFQTGASLSSLVHEPPQNAYENYREREPAAPAQPGLWNRLLHRFDGEVNKIKEVAIGTAMGWLRDTAAEAMPQYAEHIQEVMNSATTKLGGQPIEHPITEREQTHTTASYQPRNDAETAYRSS